MRDLPIPFRIAFLTHEPFYPPSGGGSAEAIYLVDEMVRRGHQVHVFGPQIDDPEGNCAIADFIHVDGARNIIFDARTRNRTPIAVVGLRDSILVQTDDAVLLAHKSQAQRVKELVRKLAESDHLKKLV